VVLTFAEPVVERRKREDTRTYRGAGGWMG
jgi:hypothetical protein